MTTILDGQRLSARTLKTIIERNDASYAKTGTRPKLVMLSVADGNLMTVTAADLHVSASQRCGCDIEHVELPPSTTEDQLCAEIAEHNFREEVTAIMVLQPLPDAISVPRVINAILPEKEVEGLHPQNLARLFPTSFGTSEFAICVPQALKLLLLEYDLYTPGKRWAVLAQDELLKNDVIASTNIRAASIGSMPEGSLLTVVSPDNPEAKEISRAADYVLATSRETQWLDESWIKRGSVVIDFLANMVGDRPHPVDPDKRLPILQGSVDAKAIEGVAGHFSPVVGGVGPMLLASLFLNCTLMHETNLSSSAQGLSWSSAAI